MPIFPPEELLHRWAKMSLNTIRDLEKFRDQGERRPERGAGDWMNVRTGIHNHTRTLAWILDRYSTKADFGRFLQDIAPLAGGGGAEEAIGRDPANPIGQTLSPQLTAGPSAPTPDVGVVFAANTALALLAVYKQDREIKKELANPEGLKSGALNDYCEMVRILGKVIEIAARSQDAAAALWEAGLNQMIANEALEAAKRHVYLLAE